MLDDDQERIIRRILIALDNSPPSLAALQVAADLAARLNAELLGLYVEDIDLIRLSDMPFAREITVYSSQSREMSREEIEQRLRSRGRIARRIMAAVAEEARLDWDFRVATGKINHELLEAAQESDLILVGQVGWSRRKRLGSTARVIVSRAPRMVMVIREGAHVGLPVGVLYDGTPAGRRALMAAIELLRLREGFLVVFISAKNTEQARERQSEISTLIQARGLHAHYRWLIDGQLSQLAEMMHFENCGALVIPADREMLDDEARANIIDQLDCPVMFVR